MPSGTAMNHISSVIVFIFYMCFSISSNNDKKHVTKPYSFSGLCLTYYLSKRMKQMVDLVLYSLFVERHINFLWVI